MRRCSPLNQVCTYIHALLYVLERGHSKEVKIPHTQVDINLTLILTPTLTLNCQQIKTVLLAYYPADRYQTVSSSNFTHFMKTSFLSVSLAGWAEWWVYLLRTLQLRLQDIYRNSKIIIACCYDEVMTVSFGMYMNNTVVGCVTSALCLINHPPWLEDGWEEVPTTDRPLYSLHNSRT